jgi:hypothetical protein
VRRQASYGITEIQRTTASDGIVFVPRPRDPVFVSTDNGRHWRPIPLVPRGFPIEASGRDVFWIAQPDSRRLYRMRDALLGQTGTAVVALLPANERFEAVQPVPGGAAAVANTFDQNPQFSLVVYRYGTVRTFSIASKPLICPGSVHTFSIDWPVVTVVADEVLSNPGPLGACLFGVGTVAFLSSDGGATWTQTTSP